MNKFQPVAITAPLTSKIKYYQGNPILKPSAENGLKSEFELMVFHIRSISKDRLIEKIGEVSKEELRTALVTLQDITTL
ncbi:mRNA interferase MazF [Algoriphagus alkaliphilus]|uniref:mRNA interferase MazF n=1 Tax=Algoriphagus alkaliphilus TaxID=279824 RepID=A0A1G5WU57_9BACT|nr:type II toxin-antitoxin system PemK/MazF family toxin [Algoriphagus alkaliphilus]SDA61057.1 mRNA interferase MazF [Algoriphagus alkaliphilus]